MGSGWKKWTRPSPLLLELQAVAAFNNEWLRGPAFASRVVEQLLYATGATDRPAFYPEGFRTVFLKFKDAAKFGCSEGMSHTEWVTAPFALCE